MILSLLFMYCFQLLKNKSVCVKGFFLAELINQVTDLMSFRNCLAHAESVEMIGRAQFSLEKDSDIYVCRVNQSKLLEAHTSAKKS